MAKATQQKHAKFLFASSYVNVTTDGRPHLGVAIGPTTYFTQIISTWVQGLKLLLSFAVTKLHAAYSAFTNQQMVIHSLYYTQC